MNKLITGLSVLQYPRKGGDKERIDVYFGTSDKRYSNKNTDIVISSHSCGDFPYLKIRANDNIGLKNFYHRCNSGHIELVTADLYDKDPFIEGQIDAKTINSEFLTTGDEDEHIVVEYTNYMSNNGSFCEEIVFTIRHFLHILHDGEEKQDERRKYEEEREEDGNRSRKGKEEICEEN